MRKHACGGMSQGITADLMLFRCIGCDCIDRM